MKLKKLSEPAIVMFITLGLLLLLTSPLWIGWMMEHEYSKTRSAVAEVNLQCIEGAVEKREVWSKLGIAVFCERDGIKHGEWQAWDGGYMHIAGQYADGDKDGIWKYFNAHGEQWGVRTYAMGKEASGLVNLLAADSAFLKKGEGKFYLIKSGKPYRSYHVRLGASHQHQGVGGIPQGTYLLDARNEDSKGRKSMHATYSEAPDQAPASKAATSSQVHFVIQSYPNRMGWAWQITGLWGATKGSVAASHSDMDEIWELTEGGTQIEVLP
ncbi:MAG: hypothetical protein F4X93_02095 [Proteobacteria bacterium]|nr:hypothetical protein [Pseudomonadota bacterium]MYB88738.1 hypothetical protein [Pseudomonadota bacterium]